MIYVNLNAMFFGELTNYKKLQENVEDGIKKPIFIALTRCCKVFQIENWPTSST